MKKILLLGGSGYIGSKFYSVFNTEYDIYSVDLQLFHNNNYSKLINYNSIKDISSYDIILCFAGHSSVQMCEYSPERSWINNVEYFHNICKKLNHTQQLIYMSSASIYGNTNNICQEDMNVNPYPIQHYDLQKIIIDIIANKYILEEKNIIGLRLGTVNGASPNTRKELMLNAMVKNSLETGVITIKNLEMKRSILGINDLMRCIKQIIEKKVTPGQYNLASFTMTVKDMAQAVSDICKSKIIINPSDKVFYSFEMSTNKFISETNFQFIDTPISIINELIRNHQHTSYSIRDNDANFIEFL